MRIVHTQCHFLSRYMADVQITEGIVEEALPNTLFKVSLSADQTVLAYLAGRPIPFVTNDRAAFIALGILVFVLVLFGVAPGIAIAPIDTATVPLLQRLVGQ